MTVGSPGGESETTGEGVGFVKEVGFKPGVKECVLYKVVNQKRTK